MCNVAIAAVDVSRAIFLKFLSYVGAFGAACVFELRPAVEGIRDDVLIMEFRFGIWRPAIDASTKSAIFGKSSLLIENSRP